MLAALLALLIGVVLGLVGGGGSILTNPVLVYAAGASPAGAIVMGYPIVGGAALLGAVQHLRAGTITARTTVPLGLAAMLGAWLGTRLVITLGLDGQVRFALLSVTMILAGVAMLRDVRRTAPPRPASETRWASLLAIGIAVGVLTGVVGVGGGFLIVPALIILGGLELRPAVGTSLLVIAMSTTASFLAQRSTADVDWGLVLPFLGLAAVGLLAANAVASRVPQRAIKAAFALALVAIGGVILHQYLTV